MKEFKLTCGEIAFLDDEDFERLPKTGWYLSPARLHNSRSNYVQHDDFGKLHRWVLGVIDPSIIVDHIDRNGMNNQKSNLRVTTTSLNKRNQEVVKSNKFNFNGISFERKIKGSPRFRVRWSNFEADTRYGDGRKLQCTKNFSLSKFSTPQEALKAAVLFRIVKMKEFDYLLDERSTTIERLLREDPNANVEQLLGIDLSSLIE